MGSVLKHFQFVHTTKKWLGLSYCHRCPSCHRISKTKKGDDDNSDNIPEYLVVTGSTFGAGQYNEVLLEKMNYNNGRPQFFARTCIRWDGKNGLLHILAY